MSSGELMELPFGFGFDEELTFSRGARAVKKICAPCCWVTREVPVRYCDAVAVAGQAYCAAHEKQNAAIAKRVKKSSFVFATKALPWRSRGYA